MTATKTDKPRKELQFHALSTGDGVVASKCDFIGSDVTLNIIF